MNLSASREFDALAIHLQCAQAISILDREYAHQKDALFQEGKKILESRELGKWPRMGKSRDVTAEDVAQFVSKRVPFGPTSPLVALSRPYNQDRKALVRIQDFTGTHRQTPGSEKVTLSIETWGLIQKWARASLRDKVYPCLPFIPRS